ncbi:MAG: dihydroorotate dehydrogenase electron transfer subunit [Gudongella sp.]|nr:dihydroorotate dehydrogenase electron transfer subunit [Gudongella sp.]
MSEDIYKNKLTSIILENTEICTGIYKMVVYATSIARCAMPGQFVNLYCNDGSRLLPRPISICEIDKNTGKLTFVYAVVGKGTEEFSNMKAGENIQLLGPLGNGYNIDNSLNEHIIVGGGVGIPPLLELVKNIVGNKKVYLGFRTGNFLIEEFKKYADEVYIATDDGSFGIKGTVVDLLELQNAKGQMIYSCGPKAMLRTVANFARTSNTIAQVSLEERMGCGIGTCVGCVVKIKNDENENGWEYKKVCKDGPVFLSEEVLWDE